MVRSIGSQENTFLNQRLLRRVYDFVDFGAAGWVATPNHFEGYFEFSRVSVIVGSDDLRPQFGNHLNVFDDLKRCVPFVYGEYSGSLVNLQRGKVVLLDSFFLFFTCISLF